MSADRPLPAPTVSLLAGVTIAACLVAIAALPQLRGSPLNSYVPLFLGAAGAYCVAVFWLDRGPLSSPIFWGLALLFRLTVLSVTPPTLSDDVYRYMWDGRLANAGVSPYAHAVDSPRLDPYDSPERALVNNDWMASPYLPTAQALFAAVYRLAPDSPFAYQVAALVLDLLTGWLVFDLLRRLGLPGRRALIYLWNPLVIVEFAHGAHIDALMLCLMMAALWCLVVGRRSTASARLSPAAYGRISALALAAGMLTKGVPALLLPVVARRWGWRHTLLYVGVVAALLLPFGLGAGWGVTGPRDGEGLFGALRIYGARWNYNGGLYHWLEVLVSGYRTPGAVPVEIVGEGPIRLTKLLVAIPLGSVLVIAAWQSRRTQDDVALLRLALVPLGAYLLLTTTVHPWYATLLIPLLPFLLPKREEATAPGRFLWPWLYFSAAVSLSYLTYLDPANLREYDWVRLIEYMPLYLLLIWAAWPTNRGADGPGAG